MSLQSLSLNKLFYHNIEEFLNYIEQFRIDLSPVSIDKFHIRKTNEEDELNMQIKMSLNSINPNIVIKLDTSYESIDLTRSPINIYLIDDDFNFYEFEEDTEIDYEGNDVDKYEMDENNKIRLMNILTYNRFYQDLMKIDKSKDYWDVLSTYITMLDELSQVVRDFEGDIYYNSPMNKYIDMVFKW